MSKDVTYYKTVQIMFEWGKKELSGLENVCWKDPYWHVWGMEWVLV